LQVVLGLITHFRNIAVTKISKDAASILDCTKDKLERYKAAAERFTIEEILYVIYTLSNTIDFIRKSGLSRVPLEAAIIKLSRSGSIASLESILDKMEGFVNSTPGVACGATPGVENKKDIPKAKAEVKQNRSGDDKSTAKAPTDLDEMLSAWSGVINHIMPKKISVAHYLQEGYPVAIEGKTVVIGFPKEFGFHKEVLEDADNRKMVEDAIKAKLNLEVKIEFRLEEAKKSINTASDAGTDEGVEDLLDNSAQSDSDPIVNTALEMFGGEISPASRMRGKSK